MQKKIARVFYVVVIITLIIVVFFAPTSGGPCTAGLDLLFVIFVLIITGILSIISIWLINKESDTYKIISVLLSASSFALWSLLLFGVMGENGILSIYMIPLWIIYFLILVSGLRNKKV